MKGEKARWLLVAPFFLALCAVWGSTEDKPWETSTAAALALYGRRFILLVREGVQLPSNLQGLYEVRYAGHNLDSDATIRLLEAIKDIKNNPMPNRYKP